MTNLEYDLSLNIEWMPTQFEEDAAEVDCEETAKNLTKLGYQKIIWHDIEKELPKCNKYVLGYDYYSQNYVVVSWNGADWTDENSMCYDITHWAELPKFDYEE